MRRSFALGFVVMASAGCAVEPGTGSQVQAIIGGTVTSTTAFPTVVDLEEEPGNWFCTGTLIDPSWVLTAAHCVVDETVAKVHVRFDDDNINDTVGGTVVAVAEIHGDPTYNDNDWDNDIALIKLATPITDRTATPVHRAAIDFGTTVTEVGYGDADDNGNGYGILRKLDTPTVDCTMAADATVLNANLLCFNAHDGDTSCYGDSGGPAFYAVAGGGLEVAGITSGGTGDTCSQGWDLYTSVNAELAFVDEIMGANTGSGSDTGSAGSDSGSGSGDPGSGGSDGGGCSTTGNGVGFAAMAFVAMFAARRRRRR